MSGSAARDWKPSFLSGCGATRAAWWSFLVKVGWCLVLLFESGGTRFLISVVPFLLLGGWSSLGRVGVWLCCLSLEALVFRSVVPFLLGGPSW